MNAYKLEKDITLYKNQFERFNMNIFGSHRLDRVSIELDGLLFRIKYMAKHNKDMTSLPELRRQFTEKALELRNIFGDFMYSFLTQIITIPDKFHLDDIEDVLAQDVKIDTTYVKFKMILVSQNKEYLEYVDNSISEDKPYNMFPNEFFRYYTDSYNDGISKAFPELFENRQQDKIGTGADADVFVHNFTFQTSESCSLNCTYCVAANTKILMGDMTEKNIEDIEVGDIVMGIREFQSNDDLEYYDLSTYFPTKVTKTFKRRAKTVKIIWDICGYEDDEQLRITEDHPILTSDGIYKGIRDIKEDEDSMIYFYPDYEAISNLSSYEYRLEDHEEEDVYNIETESHTYIANRIVVHNCYQLNKTNMRMDFNTAKKFIDELLADHYGYINRYNSPAIIIEFIGGEPLLEINLTRKIYEYFLDRCYELNHPWFTFHRLSICSNGLQYFDQDVQSFFKDYSQNISFNISIDGNKELHDACRIQPNGEGSYDIDMMALNHFNRNYTPERNSKMTLAPQNMKYLFDSVVNFIDNGMTCINLNCIFEEGWDQQTALEEYNQLKKLADYLLDNDLDHLYIAIFNERQEDMQSKYSDGNFCGGLGSMLSLRPNGQFYPCIRYMPTSVGDNVQDLCIGHVNTGMIGREEGSEVLGMMDRITRRTQSNDICYECPLSNDCAWCFRAGTLIQTINGPVRIENVRVGDEVLSQDGKYHKVYQNIFRSASTKETMVIRGVGTPSIYTTEDHPFWAKKRLARYNGDNRDSMYSEPQWIKAKDLSPNDRILIYTPEFGDLEVNYYLAYLVGRWLGDGWRSNRSSNNGNVYPQFHLCCAYDEIDEIEALFSYADIEYTKDNTKRTAQEYLIKSNTKNENNRKLISILKQCGKYSHGKRIPEEIFKWNKESLSALFEGYLSADGSKEKRPYLTRFCTVSKELAYGLSTVCRMFGKNPSWTESVSNTTIIEGRTISPRMYYDIRMYTSDNKQYKTDVDFDKDDMWVAVRSAKHIGAKYNVYNIGVEGDPSFYADGILVHNCSALSHTVYGTPGKRPMFICIQMIAEALANVYYWNLLNIKHPEYELGVRKNNVPDEWALLVIDSEELDFLKKIESYSMIITIENSK